MELRNCAIIAHVDHGKTTLVDALLKQANIFRENESLQSQKLIMDSKDQERERGITILAKNTAIIYNDIKINIIDTPGHADFGGEVERTLNMAEGALLIVDAAEGPMPQTRFVLKKALDLDLKIIVVINKIDKANADIEKALNETESLFLDLANKEEQLDFPVFYAIGREGKVWEEVPQDIKEESTVEPLLKGIVKYIPEPKKEEGEFQMLVNNLDSDQYKGLYVIGKIKRGKIKKREEVLVLSENDKQSRQIVEGIYVNKGLKRIEVEEASAGEIVALTGLKEVKIGNTITSTKNPERLPFTEIQEPTMKIRIQANTSPFSGKEG
ncbi:MAG TPA: GTP-binding protein, partial [candidate division WWE3 bacterium]|nr:GTP-binding protein [candidate division WWE3 bacterium]